MSPYYSRKIGMNCYSKADICFFKCLQLYQLQHNCIHRLHIMWQNFLLSWFKLLIRGVISRFQYIFSVSLSASKGKMADVPYYVRSCLQSGKLALLAILVSGGIVLQILVFNALKGLQLVNFCNFNLVKYFSHFFWLFDNSIGLCFIQQLVANVDRYLNVTFLCLNVYFCFLKIHHFIALLLAWRFKGSFKRFLVIV